MTLIPIMNNLQLAIIDDPSELASHIRFSRTNGCFYYPCSLTSDIGCDACHTEHPDIACMCDKTQGKFIPALVPYVSQYYPEFFI